MVSNIQIAFAKGVPVFSPLYKENRRNFIHADILLPFFTSDKSHKPLGIMIFCIDAEATLFHRVNEWPTKSLSAETNMFSRDGDYVLFNTNIPESKPLSFIGQDLFQSGKLAGQLMSIGNAMAEEIVILHIGEDVKDSVYLMEKEKGFKNC